MTEKIEKEINAINSTIGAIQNSKKIKPRKNTITFELKIGDANFLFYILEAYKKILKKELI